MAAGQGFVVCGGVGTSSTSVATHSGRASSPRTYLPPSSTPVTSTVGGVFGMPVTFTLKVELPKWKTPPVLLPNCAWLVVTVAVPTPTGVTVTCCAPAAPQALRTRLVGDTVATAGLSDARFTVRVSL